MAKAGTKQTVEVGPEKPKPELLQQKPQRPLVFISHDHRDAELAEAFANLLSDASGGILKSFRSSDRKGTAGIEFGAEWYAEIMGKIDGATDVVALLTAHSTDRPWILYEAGVAKGKLGRSVCGVVVGIPFDQATKGPFAQFQNCGDDEDSLTKLLLQIIKRNSDAEPREQAVRLQVTAFREAISKLSSGAAQTGTSSPAVVEGNSAAKLFEEVKVMFRDLPKLLEGQFHENLGPRPRKRHRRVHTMMLMDLLRSPSWEKEADRSLGWMLMISLFREDAPWLFELGLEFHRVLQRGDFREILIAADRFERSLSLVCRGPFHEMLIDGPELDMAVHELGHTAQMLAREFVPGERTKTKRSANPSDL